MASEQPPAIQSRPPPPAAPQIQQLTPIPTPLSNPPPQLPSQTTTPLPSQEANSATPETSRKRARPTVSCFECRRKKLKCDRVQPCSQCVKGRRESSCQYATGVTKVGVSRARPHEDGGRFNDAAERERKRMRVEDVMTPNSVPLHGGLKAVDRRDAPATGSTLGRIYVKGNRSRYLGVADRMAMLDHFEDAKSYIVNCFTDPDTAGLMYELTAYQKSFQRKPKKPDFPIPQDRPSLMTEILKSIPAHEPLGEAFHLYESHWEGMTRVLHVQTFRKKIEEVGQFVLSQVPRGNYSLPPNIDEAVVLQKLGVLILCARLNKQMSTVISEEEVAIWTEMMQRWLDGLKGKERLNIQTLRVQVLLLLSKMNSLAQNSDLWKESGTVVRSAMIMGLHQDPENHHEISLFEKEQRRKLWRTIVELDMQFSLAGGMPSAIRTSDFNSRPLVNVDDNALKEDMATYPESNAERLWTDALPQTTMSTSIKERLDATNILAGNINLPEDAERLFNLARYLEHCLHNLPTPSREEQPWGQSNEKSPGRLFTKIMLDVQIRRPTLCIYLHIMLGEHGGRYPEARKGALRNAVAMLGHLDALDPEVADPNTIQSRDQLNLFHILCKKDIIQAALILCLEIRSFSLASREGERRVNDVQILQDDLLPWTKTSLTRIVENTLNSLLQRLGEFGSDLKDVLPVSIVLQSARSDGSPEDKRMLMRKGTERILKACREALPHISATPATAQNDSAQTPSSNMQQLPVLRPYNAAECPLPGVDFNAYPRFGDPNMLPGNDLNFQELDFGFADWDMNGSWF